MERKLSMLEKEDAKVLTKEIRKAIINYYNELTDEVMKNLVNCDGVNKDISEKMSKIDSILKNDVDFEDLDFTFNELKQLGLGVCKFEMMFRRFVFEKIFNESFLFSKPKYIRNKTALTEVEPNSVRRWFENELTNILGKEEAIKAFSENESRIVSDEERTKARNCFMIDSIKIGKEGFNRRFCRSRNIPVQTGAPREPIYSSDKCYNIIKDTNIEYLKENKIPTMVIGSEKDIAKFKEEMIKQFKEEN